MQFFFFLWKETLSVAVLQYNLPSKTCLEMQYSWSVQASTSTQVGRHFLRMGQNGPFFRKNVNGMDICIQNVSWPMVCSIVKGHMDSNEVPAGEITSPSCLDRCLPVSEQVSCSQMKMLHLREDAKLSRTRFF